MLRTCLCVNLSRHAWAVIALPWSPCRTFTSEGLRVLGEIGTGQVTLAHRGLTSEKTVSPPAGEPPGCADCRGRMRRSTIGRP